MYAVEFETVAKNGVIQIPVDYAEFASQPVKVVLMMDDAPKSVKIAKMQSLINEGLASGISNETMQSIQERALARFTASKSV